MNFVRTSALALATTLAVLAPAAAEAASYSNPDATKDVVKISISSDSETQTKVPDRAEGDIVNSGVALGKRRITMAIRYDELSQAGDGALHLFRIGTKHKVRDVEVVAAPGRWQGAARMSKDSSGKTVKCRGMRWSIDYGADLVKLSVPRRCLGRPAWVHVGMAIAEISDPDAFLDDAATNGYIGSNIKWGPRVYR